MIILSSNCSKLNFKDSLYKIVKSKKDSYYYIIDDDDNIYGEYSNLDNAQKALNELFFSAKDGDETFRFPSNDVFMYW